MIAIVLVHGFMGGSAQWAPLMDGVQDRTEVIALDLPGFGANAHLPPINTISGFADWVIGDLQAKGVERFHLLGHSMGGMIVQEMMRRCAGSVVSLILYATGPQGVLPGRFETISESKRRAAIDGPRATARRISATWFLDQADAPGYEPCAQIAEQASLDAILAGLDAMEGWSGADHLAHIAAKTLIIWGDGDRTYAWPQIQQLWQAIPDAQLAVIPGCAHAVHLEKPPLFNGVLLDFLSQTTSP